MASSVKVSGLRELGVKLRDMELDLKNTTLRKATAAGARPIRAQAKRNAPILTPESALHNKHAVPGALKKAIRAWRRKKQCETGYEEFAVGVPTNRRKQYANTSANRRAGKVGRSYYVMPPEYYWLFVELGTVKMPPNPFLRRAFEQEKGFAVAAMKAELVRGIERATGAKLV